MTVSSTSSSVYSQYQSLAEGLRSDSTTYDEAFAAYADLFTDTRGYRPLGIFKRATDLQKVEMSAEMRERLLSVKATLDSYYASQAYAKAQAANQQAPNQNEPSAPTAKGVSLFGPGDLLENERSEINQTAYDFLSHFANAHKPQWVSAADGLDINLSGPFYLPHFYRVPETSKTDVSLDAPNSEAERIFRHIANAEDIAKFDAAIALQKKKMEDRLEAKLLGMIERASVQVQQFSAYIPKLEAAGITPEDMNSVYMYRGKDGQYSVRDMQGGSGKASTIESLINGDPELHAFYEEQYRVQWHIKAEA